MPRKGARSMNMPGNGNRDTEGRRAEAFFHRDGKTKPRRPEKTPQEYRAA